MKFNIALRIDWKIVILLKKLDCSLPIIMTWLLFWSLASSTFTLMKTSTLTKYCFWSLVHCWTCLFFNWTSFTSFGRIKRIKLFFLCSGFCLANSFLLFQNFLLAKLIILVHPNGRYSKFIKYIEQRLKIKTVSVFKRSLIF